MSYRQYLFFFGGECLTHLKGLQSTYKIQEEKMSKWLFTFLTHCDWEGSDVCSFSLATSSLMLNGSFILTFSVRHCVPVELFTAGSPAGIIVSVGLLGRASMMLEDPKLVRTQRTLLTRRSSALWGVCDYNNKHWRLGELPLVMCCLVSTYSKNKGRVNEQKIWFWPKKSGSFWSH